MSQMNRRSRLSGFTDNQFKRADELRRGDRFLDTYSTIEHFDAIRDRRPAYLAIRTVDTTEHIGDDVDITTTDGDEFTTSIGNTFLIVPNVTVSSRTKWGLL